MAAELPVNSPPGRGLNFNLILFSYSDFKWERFTASGDAEMRTNIHLVDWCKDEGGANLSGWETS